MKAGANLPQTSKLRVIKPAPISSINVSATSRQRETLHEVPMYRAVVPPCCKLPCRWGWETLSAEIRPLKIPVKRSR
jgi:hypothetical protein